MEMIKRFRLHFVYITDLNLFNNFLDLSQQRVTCFIFFLDFYSLQKLIYKICKFYVKMAENFSTIYYSALAIELNESPGTV